MSTGYTHPAVKFLQNLYPDDSPGYINLRFLPGGKNYFVPASEVEKSVPEILAENPGRDAYFQVALCDGRGGKAHITEIYALWVDVDFKEGFGVKELCKLPGTPLKASIIVGSGGGVHLYWLLREPAAKKDIPIVENLLKRLARVFHGDAASAEGARILRIPGTKNFKYDPPKGVKLVRFDPEHRYDLSEFDDILPPLEESRNGKRTPNPPGWEEVIIEHGVKKGERNMAITRLAGHYVAMGMSKVEILPILLDANSRFLPQLDRSEVERTLGSVMRTHQRNYPQNTEGERRDGKDLWEITPGLDFINGTAYVTIPRIITPECKPIHIVEVVTSRRERFQLADEALFERGLYTLRNPRPRPRWSSESIEAFLRGKGVPSLSLRVLFARIREQYRLYIDFLDQRIYSLVSVWTMGTYFHRLFAAYPYIHLNGDPQTGKTKTLELTAYLAFNGELTFHSTAAYIVRAISDNHCTCCVDEAERLRSSRDEDRQTVISMYNSGYKRGATAGKVEATNRRGKWEVRHFEAYSPKMFASIKDLDTVLKTRCIPLVMVESSDAEVKNRILNLEDPALQSIRDDLYLAMMAYHKEIKELYLKLEDGEIGGREWELWRPLLSIALAIDGEDEDDQGLGLYTELRSLALDVRDEKRKQREEETATPKVLLAFRELLGEREEGFYVTSELTEALCTYDEEHFGWMTEEKTKGNPGKFLKREIRRLAIGEYRVVRVEGKQRRGYQLNRKAIEDRLRGIGFSF